MKLIFTVLSWVFVLSGILAQETPKSLLIQTETLDFEECVQDEIFILNAMNEQELDVVKIGNWEESFQQETLRSSFVSLDEDAFDIKLFLANTTANEVSVNIFSFDRTINDPLSELNEVEPAVLDHITGLVLARTEDFFYKTQNPLLLVANNDKQDDRLTDYTLTETVNEAEFDGTDDTSSDITIHAVPGGTVVIESQTASGQQLRRVFGVYFDFESIHNDEVKIVKVNLISMLPNGNTPVPYASPAEIINNVKKANEILAQCGVLLVNSGGEEISEGDIIVKNQPSGVNLINGLTINVLSPQLFSNETLSLLTCKDDNHLTIDIFFINYFNLDGGPEAPTYGYAIPETLSDNLEFNRTCFIAKSHSSMLDRPLVTAHEIGHILTNFGHFVSSDSDEKDRNLMRQPPVDNLDPEYETIYSPKRLINSQIETIINSALALPQG